MWFLDRVTEEEVPVVLSHYEQLKELEWMIGSWVDVDDRGQVKTTCEWTRNKNFITRAFTISIEGRIDMAGMQIIGWDPAAEQIRSWMFDSDGCFGQAVWHQKGDRWVIRQSRVLAGGEKAASVNVITPCVV